MQDRPFKAKSDAYDRDNGIHSAGLLCTGRSQDELASSHKMSVKSLGHFQLITVIMRIISLKRACGFPLVCLATACPQTNMTL